MTEFLLDTDTASRLSTNHRTTIQRLRRSSATSIGISSITRSEMLFGAQKAPPGAAVMDNLRRFFARVDHFDWDRDAAEHHAMVRIAARAVGRSAGRFDLMIAAHALALGRILVTSDRALHNLGVAGLDIVDWST